MAIKIITAAILCFGIVSADDITVADLSARLDSLEKRLDGQTASGEELASTEDISALRSSLKTLTGRLEELEHLLREKTGISAVHETKTIAIGPTVAPPIDDSEQSDSGEEADLTSLPDEEAVLKLMEKKNTPELPEKNADKNPSDAKKALEKIRSEKTKEAEKKSPTLQSGSPLAQYNTAMALYDKKEYEKSQKAFADFIKNNPSDKLTHQAYYWQGDCFMKIKQIAKAKGCFAQSYQKDKTGPKAPESLFGLGAALSQENKQQQACTAWKKLQTDYPKLSPDLKKKVQDAKTKNKC